MAKKGLRIIGRGVVWLILLLMTVWAVAALCFDVRIAWLRLPCVIVYLLAVLTAVLAPKRFCIACWAVSAAFWWCSSGGSRLSPPIKEIGRQMFHGWLMAR